jgi:hypothetical protein
VIARENETPQGGKKKPAGSLDPLDCRGLLHSLRSPSAGREMELLRAQTIPEAVAAIELAAKAYEADDRVRARIRMPLNGATLPHPTRYVYVEALRYLVANGTRLATANHIYDFFHTVVSLSSCDYVVLGKNWWDAARRIQDKLRDAGLLTHEARVFKVAELPRFLELAATDEPSVPKK